jgi:hypothetical protein
MSFVLVSAGSDAISVSPGSKMPSVFSAMAMAMAARRRESRREIRASMSVRV